jgi:hypothetical protein
MYAQIDCELIDKKARLFEIGKVYTIKKFLVNKSKATYSGSRWILTLGSSRILTLIERG